MKRFLTLIIAVASVCSLSAASNMQVADSLYAKAQFLEALQIYEQVAQEEGTSAALLFNTGNAAVKANRYGTAMVAYQRAAALDPGNSRIRHNIAYLQSKIDDRNTAKLGSRKGDMNRMQPSATQALWLRITAAVNPDTWGWLGLISFALVLTGALAYIFFSNVVIRKTGFFAAIICLALTVIFAVFTAFANRHWDHREQSVVTAFETQILPKPDSQAKAEFTPVAAGTLLDTPEAPTAAPDGWVYVRLNSTVEGWVPSADLTAL